MNKITLLKRLDQLVGGIAVRLTSLFIKDAVPPEWIRRILFIRPGGIGDAVLLVPSLKFLRNVFPGAEIEVLAERRNCDVFSLCKEVNRLLRYDRPSDLLTCLKRDYQIVIDTEQWHRLSAVVAALTGAPIRAGFGTNLRRDLFNVAVSYSHDEYEVFSFYNLVKEVIRMLNMGIAEDLLQFGTDTPFLEVDESAVRDWVAETVNDYERRHPLGYCVISPGATVRERRWGGQRYGEVARELLKNGCGVIVVGTGDDRRDGQTITDMAEGSLDLTGRTTLREVAYLIKRAKLFIGPDSGVLHIAVGVGTHTVSLFGSGIEAKWAPRGKGHVVLNKRLPCSPCTRFGYTPRCNMGVRCLSEITEEEVIHSALRVLNE